MSRFAPRGAALVISLTLVGCAVQTEVPLDQSAPPPQSPPPAEAPPAQGQEQGGASAEQRMARDIFDRVNDERRQRGMGEVAWSGQLATVAKEWSAEMAQRGTLEHQDVRALLRSDRVTGLQSIGENIFRATGPVPAGAIHVGWMTSDTHRVNVLNPGFNRLGVGVFCADDGSVWATQEFGRTVGADRPPLVQETPPASPIARPQEDGPSCG